MLVIMELRAMGCSNLSMMNHQLISKTIKTIVSPLLWKTIDIMPHAGWWGRPSNDLVSSSGWRKLTQVIHSPDLDFDNGGLVRTLSIPTHGRYALASTCARRFPNLRELRLVQMEEGHIRLDDIFHPFANHQELRYLHLDLQHIVQQSGPTAFPASHVQHLTIYRNNGSDTHTVQQALTLWPSLSTLVIASFYEIHGLPLLTGLSTLFLGALPYRHYASGDIVYLCWLLACMPNLRTLSVIHIHEPDRDDTAMDEEHLEIPYSQIVYIQLKHVHGPPALIRSLSKAPALTRVHLSGGEVTVHDVASAIQPMNDVLPLIQNVHTLVVELSYGEYNEAVFTSVLTKFAGELVLAGTWNETVGCQLFKNIMASHSCHVVSGVGAPLVISDDSAEGHQLKGGIHRSHNRKRVLTQHNPQLHMVHGPG